MENFQDSVSKRSPLSKRSTRAGVCLVVLSLGVGLYNGVLPQGKTVEIVSKASLGPQGAISAATPEVAAPVVLENLVISKDPNSIYDREQILNDYQDRISKEFDIPAGLRERVGFWFDIYTRHNSFQRVIHYSQQPWIIFKVVDVTEIIEAPTPKFRWMRNQKADDHVQKELKKVRAAVTALAKGARFNKNDPYHVLVADALKPLKGTLQQKAKRAQNSVRVQTGQKDFFAKGLEVSPRYLPGMEEIFRNHKLPTELTRLPFVESSFNKHATSKVGASGIWQFMDYTGKNFMIVNDHIDERRSPFKATVGAARLLKENHMILKRSWPLAITAWNHGPGGIRRAMKAMGTSDLSQIVGKYSSKSFDFASSNFYCEFLAALYAEKYHDQIFPHLNYEKTLDLHAVKLAQRVSAQELFRRSGLAKEDFLLFNPDLKKALEKNHPIPAGFTVMVDTPSQVVLNNLLTKDTRASKATKISQSGVSSNENPQRN